ncbi:hypothetical protein LAZ67_3005881 [Cordylochernes scorpioides]|uniref:Endonuclease/exonuclease/phosphatase domain-containing protein n=1 Tax=Cordylochernes scorpioides TaxID=51811 RepID=A0ABY6KAP3_9ARAC|nr:hypothetical protein LAZ67_3005881 [Cordylochernes scorpioides]
MDLSKGPTPGIRRSCVCTHVRVCSKGVCFHVRNGLKLQAKSDFHQSVPGSWCHDQRKLHPYTPFHEIMEFVQSLHKGIRNNNNNIKNLFVKTVLEEEDSVHFSIKFENSVNLLGMPSHNPITLKVRADQEIDLRRDAFERAMQSLVYFCDFDGVERRTAGTTDSGLCLPPQAQPSKVFKNDVIIHISQAGIAAHKFIILLFIGSVMDLPNLESKVHRGFGLKLTKACKACSQRISQFLGYGGAASVLMLESAAKASASMLGTASNYRQSQTFTKVCLDHGAMINESCTPTPHSMRSDVDLHAASPVAQNKQGRVQDLGRGFCPISIIQSPQTSNFAASKQLSILQCNINGLCSTATKIKLEEIMEIAEKQKIQIIALQETKLNEKYNLKYKNYNILRKDRNKEGGGLAFLIKNLYYEDIAFNIPNTSDLEAQEISTKTKTSSIKEKFWNFKKANWNLYQQNTNEDFRKAPTRIKDLEQNWISFKNTIIKAAKVSIPRDYALENTDLNKTPGPDGIHGQMISNLGKNGKEKLLDIFNNSWKTGKLPQDWKTATIIPIKKT